MTTFTFEFTGKLKGALGLASWHIEQTNGATEDEARLKLYDNFDHIQDCRVTHTHDAGMDQKIRESFAQFVGINLVGFKVMVKIIDTCVFVTSSKDNNFYHYSAVLTSRGIKKHSWRVDARYDFLIKEL